MENSKIKSWHLELAENIKLKPSSLPKDIFFQFKKHQPYKFDRVSSKRLPLPTKIPHNPLHIRKDSSQEAQKLSRPSSQCSSYRCSDLFEMNNSKMKVNASRIEKTSKEILKEIDSLLNKENKNKRHNKYIHKEPNKEEKKEIHDEYLPYRKRISLLNRGRVPLKRL